jgi:hypothetical protein
MRLKNPPYLWVVHTPKGENIEFLYFNHAMAYLENGRGLLVLRSRAKQFFEGDTDKTFVYDHGYSLERITVRSGAALQLEPTKKSVKKPYHWIVHAPNGVDKNFKSLSTARVYLNEYCGLQISSSLRYFFTDNNNHLITFANGYSLERAMIEELVQLGVNK